MRSTGSILLVALVVSSLPIGAQEAEPKPAAPTSTAAEPAPEIPWADAEGITAPTLKKEVAATYPEKAGDLGMVGKVDLQVLVKADGTTSVVKVFQSIPLEFGFEEAATRAVEQWRYEPATKGGKPIDVYLKVTVRIRK